jgi:hypothetical protein
MVYRRGLSHTGTVAVSAVIAIFLASVIGVCLCLYLLRRQHRHRIASYERKQASYAETMGNRFGHGYGPSYGNGYGYGADGGMRAVSQPVSVPPPIQKDAKYRVKGGDAVGKQWERGYQAGR